MKTKCLLSIVSFTLFFLYSCDSLVNKPAETIKKEVFSGYVQKGPFMNGSSVLISELDINLDQTGRIYSSTIADNAGSFEQKKIELISSYVQMKADGYYFNEVSGESSSGQLTLYALADISKVNSVNVNVLTHLEKSRVEYLVQQKKLTFSAAKKQAQQEVLNIFNLALTADSTSESLNLSSEGDNNAILLAISCILQGSSTTAEMSELMGNIITDIKTDGTLDNSTLCSTLIDNARLINSNEIRKNMENKYVELGLTDIIVPDFEKKIQTFLTKSTYTPLKYITYPVSGDNGLNLLNDTVRNIPKKQNSIVYSMKAELPKGTNLRIVLKGDKVWAVSDNYSTLAVNWIVNPYNTTTKSQEFVVKESNTRNDLYFSFYTASIYSNITIEFYENNAIIPTRVKSLVVGSSLQYIYPSMGVNGPNILSTNFTKTMTELLNSLRAEVSSGGALKIIITGGGSWKTIGTVTNWTVESFNAAKQWQIFTVTEVGKPSDLPIIFTSPGIYKIDYYENNDIVPSHSKQITVV